MLSEDDVRRLDERAVEVGRKIGWELRFMVASNPEYVGLVAGSIVIVGPAKLSDLAAHDIEMDLELLESGARQIVLDEDGDPRLI